MNKLLYFLLPLFLSLRLSAQTEWVNYTNSYLINHIAFEGDSLVWVCTYGGLISLNRQTGERQIFQPTNSGLRGTNVSTAIVSSQGTKWLGNRGLAQLDGLDNWQRFYDINTGDTLKSVYGIKEAPNGDLWILATEAFSTSAQLFRYDGVLFENTESIFGMVTNQANSVRHFDVGTDGGVWVRNPDKIQYMDAAGNHAEFDATDLGLLSNESFENIVVGPNNEAYFQTRYYEGSDHKIKLRKFDGASWLPVPILGNDVWAGRVSNFFTDPQDNLWFLMLDDNNLRYVLKYDGADWQSWLVNDLPNIPAGTAIRGLLAVDDNGHWWFDMFTSKRIGLAEFDGTDWTQYNVEIFPLGEISIDGLAFDCQHNAWLGGLSYLTSFDGVSWKNFSGIEMGLEDNSFAITGMAADNLNCYVYLSYHNNGVDTVHFSKYNGNTFTHYYIPQGGSVTNMLPTAQGGLWLTTEYKGLTYFDGNTFSPWLDDTNAPIGSPPSDLALDVQGGLWVASGDKGLSRYYNGSWTTYNASNSPLQYPVDWVFIDRDQNVWIDNEGSPMRFDGLNWDPLFVTNASYGVISMAEDANGKFWFGGLSEVYAYDGNGITTFTLDNSPLGSTTFRNIQVDPFNNKWFVPIIGATVYNEEGISNQVINPLYNASGQVVFDTNMDGNLDVGTEPGLPNQKVLLEPDSLMAYSSIGGFYQFNPLPGSHQLSLLPETGYVPTTTNPLDVLMADASQSGFDFGVWTANPPGEIEVQLTTGVAICDQTSNVWVNVNNKSILPATGKVKLEFNPIYFTYASSNKIPESIQGNTITWNYELDPYEYDPIVVTFGNPGVSAEGLDILFQATATRIENNQTVETVVDESPSNVVCSYDPNDKNAEANGMHDGAYSLLTDALDYTIRFQNKGSYTAFSVVIRDTLDPALDPESFEILSFSHPVRATITKRGVVTFSFDNINLPWEDIDEQGSQGFVKYRIAPKAGLPDPTAIHNTAHIYFDLNPAIVTNTTENILVEMLTDTEDELDPLLSEIKIYPNPSSGSFWLETEENTPLKVCVTDIYGRLVKEGEYGQKVLMEGLGKGFYFAHVWHNGRYYCEKVLVL